MLHAVPMFFYNFLFHARRPDPDRFFDDDENNNNDEKDQDRKMGTRKKATGVKSSKSSCHSPNRYRRRKIVLKSSKRKRLERKQQEAKQGESPDNNHYNHDDDDDDDNSTLSTGNGRIRSLQRQIQLPWMILPMLLVGGNPVGEDCTIPPMPKIPFVSIDVKTLESTEHSDDEDEDFGDDTHMFHFSGKVEFLLPSTLGGSSITNSEHPESTETDDCVSFVPEAEDEAESRNVPFVSIHLRTEQDRTAANIAADEIAEVLSGRKSVKELSASDDSSDHRLQLSVVDGDNQVASRVALVPVDMASVTNGEMDSTTIDFECELQQLELLEMEKQLPAGVVKDAYIDDDNDDESSSEIPFLSIPVRTPNETEHSEEGVGNFGEEELQRFLLETSTTRLELDDQIAELSAATPTDAREEEGSPTVPFVSIDVRPLEEAAEQTFDDDELDMNEREFQRLLSEALINTSDDTCPASPSQVDVETRAKMDDNAVVPPPPAGFEGSKEDAPNVPFVSIDLRPSNETTVSDTEEEDGDSGSSAVDLDDQERRRLLLLKTLADSNVSSRLLSDCDHEKNLDEANKFISLSSGEDEESLSADDLVPLRDEDINTSSDGSGSQREVDVKENKPQSFLIDYLSSNHHSYHNSDTCNQSHSSVSLHQRREPLKQLLERVHANILQHQHLRPSTPQPASWHHDSTDHARTTSVSTPYHLVQPNSSEQGRRNRHAAHTNRFSFPSQIIIPTKKTDCLEQVESVDEDEILDPTDPLVCGKVGHSPYLTLISDRMNHFLIDADDTDDIDDVCLEALGWIKKHPMTCQIKYQPPDLDDDTLCLPLHYFSAAGWVQGCIAAYHAFPEAIGLETSQLGLPLHYACLHQTNTSVVSFLVEKFPDATRFTNQDDHQTPLHLACQSPNCHLDTVKVLLEHYPTAAQLADAHGRTPLHYACEHRLPLPILQALQASGPAVIGAATRTWHKPLHLAALHGCSVEVLEWLLQIDKRAAACTLDDFSTPLHCAVMGLKDSAVDGDSVVARLECLRDAHPDAIEWTNSHDQTPFDLAVSTVEPDAIYRDRILQVLKPL